MRIVSNGAKNDIIKHFKVQLKVLKSPSALRISTYTNTTNSGVTVDLIDLVCIGSAVTYLYLMVDVPLDKYYIERYRVVLSRHFLLLKLLICR